MLEVKWGNILTLQVFAVWLLGISSMLDQNVYNFPLALDSCLHGAKKTAKHDSIGSTKVSSEHSDLGLFSPLLVMSFNPRYMLGKYSTTEFQFQLTGHSCFRSIWHNLSKPLFSPLHSLFLPRLLVHVLLVTGCHRASIFTFKWFWQTYLSSKKVLRQAKQSQAPWVIP